MNEKINHNSEHEINRLNEALKQLSFQNQMMLSWVNGAVITVDREGNVVHANEVALQNIGWNLAELTGLHLHNKMQHSQDDGSEYPWEFSPIFAAIEDGSSHHVDGDVFWHKDGSSFKVDYIVSPVRDENNDITGAIIIFRNLTAQKLVEAKRIHGMKLESIGELSAGIAHEINTPMQFIGNNVSFLQESFAELLEIVKDFVKISNELKQNGSYPEQFNKIESLLQEADLEYLEEEVPTAFSQTQDGIKRVTNLILNLKGFAHSSSTENKTPTDINTIIDNAVTICQNAYKYVADVVILPGEIPIIDAFSGDISQVMVNLIVNAAHAIELKDRDTLERGTITIKSYIKDSELVISVQDTGVGIPEKLKSRIFDPFFTTKDIGQGSGQGLAISRTIIHDKHNGDLSFQSEVNKGTTFYVRLPVK